MSDHDQLSQYVDQYEAAYDAHRKTYALRNPPPIQSKLKRENILALAALGLMVIASVIVSGSRTVIEFGGGVIGFAAFTMIEAGIVSYAYIRTRVGDDERQMDVRKMVTRGMWLAFVVAVSANVHAELKNNGIDPPPIIDVVILVVLAISAPVLAFIAGDTFGMFAVMDAQRQRQADETYQKALDLWRDGLNASWNAQKARMGVSVRLSAPERQPDALPPASAPSVSVQTDARQTQQTGFGYNRTSDGQAQVIDYLNAHPDEADLPLRTLAVKIGVNKDTVNAGRKLWRAAKPTVRDVQVTAMRAAVEDATPVIVSNGHHEEPI